MTLADGKTYGFTFEPEPGHEDTLGLPDGSWFPFFVPDPDTPAYLAVKAARLIKVGDEYFDIAANLPYHPGRIEFGGAYTLYTRDGMRLGIDAADTSRSWISDRNGNILLFTDDGIESRRGPANQFGEVVKGYDPATNLEVYVVLDRAGNMIRLNNGGLGESTGRKVRIERDYAGRIVGVIDPAGQRISYAYDSNGDLASVTDRTAATTSFSYLNPEPCCNGSLPHEHYRRPGPSRRPRRVHSRRPRAPLEGTERGTERWGTEGSFQCANHNASKGNTCIRGLPGTGRRRQRVYSLRGLGVIGSRGCGSGSTPIPTASS